MRKTLQFAFAAGSMLILASAATAQDATVRRSPLFQVQPQIAQQYAPYLSSTSWRAPVLPLTWDVQAPFTLEEIAPTATSPLSWFNCANNIATKAPETTGQNQRAPVPAVTAVPVNPSDTIPNPNISIPEIPAR